MAIVQISKIIHRLGAEIDLPQLDTGEIGFASDTNKVFIGNDPIIHPPGNPSETTQTELLTDNSTIAFSQLGGAAGTGLNLSNVDTGQLLVANAGVWTNAGGNIGGLITLGKVSNVKITGGIGGYVLQTDGAGNLSWTTNGVVKNDIANIAYLANHTLDNQGAVLVTTKLPHLFATGSAVTIMNVSDSSIQQALSDSGVGGENSATGVYHATNRYFVRRLSETTFSLYTDPDAITNPVNGTGWTDGTYTANTGYALGFVPATTVPGAGGTPGGSNTQVQFNNAGRGFAGSSNFTFNRVTNLLSVAGNITASNANLGNLTTSNFYSGDGSLLSSITGGNVTGEVNFAAVANSVAGGNVSGEVAFAAVANSVAGTNVTGEVAFAAVANSVAGTNVTGAVGLATYATTANSVTGTNVSGEVAFAATANSVAGANVSGEVAFAATANSVAGGNVTSQVANALIAGTVYSSAQPAITSVGTLTSLAVTGNVTSGNANLGNLTISNYFSGNGSLLTSVSVTGVNVSGQVANALISETVYSSAQPAITSLGDLVSLNVIGNITSGNLIANTASPAPYISGFSSISTSTINLGQFSMFSNIDGVFFKNTTTDDVFSITLTLVTPA